MMEKQLNNNKALVVFSGGQDSTTCLFWAMERYSDVEVVTFNYGQRHALEIDVAKQIANEHGIKHHILDMSLLTQLSPNALTNHNAIITDDGEVPNTFVPARNLLFMSFAAALAYQIEAKHIITGVCETDFSGYPDCRDNFIKSLNVTINLSMDVNFEIHTPLMWLDKKETWALADTLGKLDYVRNKTLTCYEGIAADGCGECPSCKLRNKGLNDYLNEKEVLS
ncbi:7-cyano-7-deazaguanine synthase QueC [Macrococcoides bohemicum]|uniref:7-cyano-7-deazaguanine synthase n=2 Tax=Macrococcoides bohemicum TaxID=1903056 RepID=A0AAE7Q1R7_9STAP|nr:MULTISPECIES: 7-cyano-7-deazaguanine synthase QueC [Macrococcus]QRN49265.1 7-cyano-7-deazaguanine synthase QueC [Macrococcus bohemicus]QYA43527.1 7-cyano-7-deazaguanine synthase QueC [Macrococcus bohemicus]QYA45915.1 7-cyano-7-deazaguanine synthase QueC [Macrococcus bohemicus]